MQRVGYVVVVLLVACSLVISPIAGVAGAAVGPSSVEGQTSTATIDDDVLNVTDEIAVWERTPATLRADPGAEGAVSVEFRADLDGPDGEPVNEIIQDRTVFKAGEDVTMEFGALPDISTSALADEEVQILNVKLDEDSDDLEDADDLSFPMSIADLEDSLTQENLTELNDRAEFQLEENQLDENGELEYTFNDGDFDDDGPGMYASVVATGEGLEVDDGDLDIVDETTIVGLEHLPVQEEPSEVDVDDAEPGDTITFDVDATTLDDGIDQGIVLYDEDTLNDVDNDFRINITEELDRDFEVSDIEIQHDIESINGIQSLEDDVSLFGVGIGEQSVTGVTPLEDAFKFITSEAGDELDEEIDNPTFNATDDVVLNASSTAVSDVDADTEIDVETFENWSEGEYRWVHVAAGDESDEFQTQTGTIDIEEEVDDPPPAPPGPPAPDPDPDPKPDDPPEVPADPHPEAIFDERQTAAIDEKTGLATAQFGADSPVNRVSMNTDVEVDIYVQGFDHQNPPDDLRLPGEARSLQSITVSEGFEETAGTIEFVLDKADVEDEKIDEGHLTAFRYDEANEQWVTLETESIESDGDRVSLEAETDRFSYFAVSETEPPTAAIDIQPDTTVEEGETVTFSAADSEPGSGEIVEYEWTADGEVIGTDEVIEDSFDEGEYEIELTVTDDAGQSDTATETLTVEEDPVDPEETREVTVIVTDDDGNPIPGATVEIGGETVTADDDGVVTIELEDGTYEATIEADGYETMTEEITVDGEAVESTFELSVDEPVDDGWPTWLWAILVLLVLGLIGGGLYLWYLTEEKGLDLREEIDRRIS